MNEYVIGYDPWTDKGRSKAALCLWDNTNEKIITITQRQWKINLILFVGRIFGWKKYVQTNR